jgi:hypothetical protein
MTTQGKSSGSGSGSQFSARIVKTSSLKKKNRLGLFYKRTVSLTDEPKIFYFREAKLKTKHLTLHPETTRLERLDSTKFKLTDFSRNKKGQVYVFRCYDAGECSDWVHKIMVELDKLKYHLQTMGGQGPFLNKAGS